ncbi:MAG: hypothetical protein IJL80_14025 [Treponema sp.]|nr:hypothetical protein [Treponema sp.]
MKKLLCILASAFACGTLAWSLGVDEPEIQSAGKDSVQFENYGGPHAVIETAAAITNIGTELGRVTAQDLTAPVTAGAGGKYTVIHAVDPETEEGLDADIMLLNPNAGVDHIRNLRRIITGYLEAAYGYDSEDAETISVFVTVYNAVYRGQMDYFAEKYKGTVLDELDEEKVGLSTIWSEWPGNTQIVIPLNDPESGVSSVDTTTISDEQVVEALRQDEDKGIEARQALTEIKEKEATTATQRAQDAQKEAAVQKVEAAKAETPEAKEAAIQKAEEAAATATKEQQLADRKNLEVKEERQEIAADMAEVPPEPDTSNYVTGLFGADDASGLYTLMTVDGATGEVVKSSPVTEIHGKNIYMVEKVTARQEDGTVGIFASLFIAVCGTNDGHSAVRLCLIDPASLEIVAWSEETLSESSELLRSGDNFYVVVEEDGEAYIAAYSKDLTQTARSGRTVKATTPLNLINQGLLVTSDDGAPLLLSTGTLEQIW